MKLYIYEILKNAVVQTDPDPDPLFLTDLDPNLEILLIHGSMTWLYYMFNICMTINLLDIDVQNKYGLKILSSKLPLSWIPHVEAYPLL